MVTSRSCCKGSGFKNEICLIQLNNLQIQSIGSIGLHIYLDSFNQFLHLGTASLNSLVVNNSYWKRDWHAMNAAAVAFIKGEGVFSQQKKETTCC